MTAARREYPPFVSYLIATLMAVSLLSLQATLPFKLKELGGSLASVGFLFMWTSFWYVMAGLFLSRITQQAGPRQVMLTTLAICSLSALLLPFTTVIWHVWGLATGYFVSACLFWAAMEHASTGLHSRLTLIKSTTLFGVAFSMGNVIGLMASSLLQARTTAVPFFVSAGVLVVVVCFLDVAGRSRPPPVSDCRMPIADRRFPKGQSAPPAPFVAGLPNRTHRGVWDVCGDLLISAPLSLGTPWVQ